MTDKANEVYGICLRGKAGWGENMAFLSATANSFGARWFDENWKPQFDQPEWKKTMDFYVRSDERRRVLPAPPPTVSTRTWRCSTRANAACGSMPR